MITILNKKNKISNYIFKIFATGVTVLFLITFYSPNKATSQNVSTKNQPEKISFDSQVSRANLKARYEAYLKNATSTIEKLSAQGKRSGKIKILVVPGHDNEYPGAIAGSKGATGGIIRETDLNLKIAGYLKSFLEQETAFEVYTTRDASFIKNNTENNQDKNGYTDYFQKYLDENIFTVLDYKDLYKKATENRSKSNSKKTSKVVEHVPAPGEMLYRLYAVNKFMEDNQIDIAIHIHLNDYAGRNVTDGQYKGFSIYVPDNSLRNGKQSQELAKYIAKAVDDKFKYSDNPIEKNKIILGNELIANGSNNTTQAASVLIEYGYIYEKQFQDDEVLKSAAEQTYLGIKNYFNKN